MRTTKPNVLFLCTGNSARSQMAEALLRLHAGDRFTVYSAGLEPKGIHPLTYAVMAERGLSMDGHSSKDVMEYLGRLNVAWLITVCGHAEARCPTAFVGVPTRVHWGFEDPAAFSGSEAERLAVFRSTRDAIEAQILAWVAGFDVPASSDNEQRVQPAA